MSKGPQSNQKHGMISISTHANQRLAERFPDIHKNNRRAFVTAARYNGLTQSYLKNLYPKLEKYIFSHFHFNNSTEIRFYKNGVFVYSGRDHKARVLVTAYALDQKLIDNLTKEIKK